MRVASGAALLLLGAASHADRASAQDAVTTDKVEVRGRVLDASTGTPIHGAYVALAGQDWGVLSDDNGRFVLRVDRASSYAVVSESLGYERRELTVRRPIPRQLTVRLDPSPIQLDGIQVMSDRFRARRMSASMSVRAFERSDLLDDPAQDVVEYLRNRMGRPLRECPFVTAFASMCTFRRGRLTPVQVYIDELPTLGGLAELENTMPQELYLVEVYGSGAQIRIYTTQFMTRMVRSGRLLNPLPIR